MAPMKDNRAGFTLVELLMVIAVIAILAALASWGVIAMMGNRQAEYRGDPADGQQNHAEPLALRYRGGEEGHGFPRSQEPGRQRCRAGSRVLWIKFRLREAFPQSYAEIGTAAAPPFVYTADGGGNPWIPLGQRRYIVDYQKHIANLPPAVVNNPGPTQSAACLLMAISVNRGGNVLSPDQIQFAVKDTDGDGVVELVDGWNTPLSLRLPDRANVQAVNPASTAPRRPSSPIRSIRAAICSRRAGTTLSRTMWHERFSRPVLATRSARTTAQHQLHHPRHRLRGTGQDFEHRRRYLQLQFARELT